MTFPEPIQAWDEALLLLINGAHTEFWDNAMLAISGNLIWLPIYIALLALIFHKFGWKVAIIILLSTAVVITLCDQISVNAFKERFERLRPCKEEHLAAQLHMVKNCGGYFGFVSSHAANTFGVAVFISALMRNWWLSIGLILWAAVVSYSRVYLGVHYPTDVLGGALLGSIIGYIVFLFFRYGIKRSKFG